ncbi:glycosyltransferase-like protein [Leptolyngbya sp. Heron Island J]|uniref:glycosyltransferase family 4 protein n=1 Tax=Leptolyngbya sp. Heron Island J TaxID=1385935 RepID=UPI0003B9FAED|nr:glycosyltransferase family 4 protein [Leptolyngbya sp. Heron Island J]ESA38757.1 glycosyltransferase-like protein [Leptolyngbya sp. Heron Island J]
MSNQINDTDNSISQLSMQVQKIIGFPRQPGDIGGPSSFQSRLERKLIETGCKVTYPKDNIHPDVILVVNSTSKILWVLLSKLRGSRIVHRLDGLFWRSEALDNVSLSIKLKHKVLDLFKFFIRNFLADEVVYQSEFIKDWWHKKYGKASCRENIIYNGADLEEFYPREKDTTSLPRILCVEGYVQDDIVTLKTLTEASTKLASSKLIEETWVCGEISQDSQKYISRFSEISIRGKVPRDEMSKCFSIYGIYLVLEINPPCPNSVIEALASGMPVVGFDTGALRELVPPNAGVLVPYDGNPWKLEEPNFELISEAIAQVLTDWHAFSKGARETAEQKFSLDTMFLKYRKLLGV